MPTRPQQHPLADAHPAVAARAILPRRPAPLDPPAGGGGHRTVATTTDSPASTRVAPRPDSARGAHDEATSDQGASTRTTLDAEDGSVATEYGLLAVVAATIVSVMLEWATSGGITNLLASVMARVSSLVGL